MALPDAAQSYWLQQQRINAATVAVAVRAWDTSGGDPDRWQAALPLILEFIRRAQRAVAELAQRYVPDVLRSLSLPNDPIAAIDATPLIGFAGSGFPLGTLYAALPERLALNAARLADAPGVVAGDAVFMPGLASPAMAATTRQFEANLQTVMSDTGRAVESMEIAVRPGIGYVRMLNPPSCKRCVILAGKHYRWNAGFERHPRCDCRHIPSAESTADDLRVDPDGYFRSLTHDHQDETFGVAAAQAIRDGANVAQVVNASRGMRTAQVYDRTLDITTEGVTKRGIAGKAIRARGRSPATTPRLMPSSIYEVADDRADAVRLMRMNGYIATDGTPSVPTQRDAASVTLNQPTPPATASGNAGGPPGQPPTNPAGPGATDEPEGWHGHTRGYVHPHRTPLWSEAVRVARQAALGGVVPAGEQLHQHEIEAVERLVARGERLEWIPLGEPDARGRRPPTNDFIWTSNGGIAAELKSTSPKYGSIRGHISAAVRDASERGVIKENFVIDIGRKQLSAVLRHQLAQYNSRGDAARRIAALWVLTRGELVRIELE